eukprot:superscaffoldBa00000546_g5545
MESLHKDMAATLLTVMLVVTYICEGALLRKSTASDFLQKIRAKRVSECFPGGCSTEDSEAGELIEVDLTDKKQRRCRLRIFHFTMSATGPEGSGGASSNRRLQQTQAQVDEVVDIMRVNVDKVLERDQKLSELDDRADALQAGASQFETSAAKLKRKYWWKNCKMWAILIAVIVIIVIIIINNLKNL